MILWDDYSARVDWAYLVKGASTGFTTLVVGGLAAPLMSRIPVIGVAWLVIVAVAAFAVSGSRIGNAPSPAVHGASAAVASYLLVLPLVAITSGTVDLQQIFFTALVALAVGGLVGALIGRRRTA
jgi:hypothetical protein